MYNIEVKKFSTGYSGYSHDRVQRLDPHGIDVSVQDDPLGPVGCQVGLVTHDHREQSVFPFYANYDSILRREREFIVLLRDQMARLFFQYLAIDNNKYLTDSLKDLIKLLQYWQNFAKYGYTEFSRFSKHQPMV